MSEHDEQRPLTRRELRLREMGETGALDLSEVAEAPAEPEATAPDEDVVAAPVSEEIEISPVNEDGSPRSRREMRQLREDALAARAAAQPAAPVVDESASNADPAADENTDETHAEEAASEPEVSAEPEASAEAAETVAEEAPAAPLTGEMDFDSLISPPTEPFTVDELREAEAERSAEEPAEAPEADEQPSESEASESEDAEEATAEPKAKRRFPWQRRGAEVEAEDEIAPEVEAESDSADVADLELTEAAEAEENAAPAGALLADPAPAEAADDLPSAPTAEEPSDEAHEAEVTEAEVAEEVVPEPVAAKPSYSFPDIAPPEEWRSVFDDPATRSMPAQSGDAQGGFDDLISRAVAQEGAVGATNTSALILPSMPEETTGGLTGPLGGTGDLYVTGSLKLPKSLGETGGHSSLHDSIEIDPITGAETNDPQTTGHGPAPVSARHAVSARVDSTIPVVAKPAKEHSKLPLILSLTGGGLLLAVVALGIWGASNGMFG
ncbi:hypothetical protein [Leucobacter chromiireducens]|uniref:Uncharacterized protein n=1 Tax=Leucobacter chromiireducens subsp. chromiireducens TaxID=660067 RepID=A0ABS1SRD3_9MICO|nr:hypothetical protein [Leucobacter chromiireducens]MBL3690708.1 hypothetical protein [Leucobacter chromiireducens subsp. chromiireducens]